MTLSSILETPERIFLMVALFVVLWVGCWSVWRKQPLGEALRLLGIVGGLLMMLSASWLMWLGIHEVRLGNVDSGIKIIGVAAILFLLANVERFESLKVFGLSAKTRALTQSLDKAVATIAQLKDVTAATSKGFLSALAATHDLGKSQASDTLDLRSLNTNAILARNTLRSLEVDEETIGKTLKPWKDCILVSVIEYTICARLQHGACGASRELAYQRLADKPIERQALDRSDLFFRSDMPRKEVPEKGYKFVLNQIDTTISEASRLDQEFGDRCRELLWPWRGRIQRLYEENSLGDGDYWNVASRNLAEPIG